MLEFRHFKDFVWKRTWWVVAGLLIIGLLVGFNRVPIDVLKVPLVKEDLGRLPLQVFYSWLRMLVAYIAALLFAISIGTLAATDEKRARILLPLLDILQSIPVLGFFPTAIYWFVSLGRGSAWGVEAAVVFLIFTSQSWNLVFGVYDGIKGIPSETMEVFRSLGHGPISLFRKLILPAVFPRLVYNSILSWANGWYFLIACEIIAMGPLSYQVPGLGTYLSQAIERKDWGAMSMGIFYLVLVIVLMSFFIWKPLEAYAQQFKFESTKREENAGSVGDKILSRYRNSAYFAPLRFMGNLYTWTWNYFETSWEPTTPKGYHETRRWKWSSIISLGAFWFVLGIGMSMATSSLVRSLFPPFEINPLKVGAAVLVSAIRLGAGYLLCVAIVLAIVFAIHKNARSLRNLQSVSQILASIPATAFFPLIAVMAQQFFHSAEAAVLLLLLTGMIWYLFFNLISGAAAIPNDIREAAESLGVKRFLYFKTVFLPALFPALVTGSITAVGGGWNALIISEYFRIGDTTHQVFGIGSYLAQATYGDGDQKLLSMSLLFMVSFIILLNRYFWQPLYRWSEEKYRLEG